MRVFISHASEDDKIACQIMNIFDKYNIDYWIDKKDLVGYDYDIWNEICKGIKSSSHFLLLFSKDAKRKEYVRKECNTAWGSKYFGVKCILKLGNEELWHWLKTKRYEPVSIKNIDDKMREMIQHVFGKDPFLIDKFEEYLNSNFDPKELIEQGTQTYADILKKIDIQQYKQTYSEWLDLEYDA